MVISVFDKIVYVLGKGENAGYKHFLLFLQCFQKVSFLGLLKVGLCGEKLPPLLPEHASVTCLSL